MSEENMEITPRTLGTIAGAVTTPHEHCLHYNGEKLATNPTQHQKTCCHCGGFRNDRNPDHSPSAGPHGPYIQELPLRYRR